MSQPNDHLDESELQSTQDTDATVDHRPESTIFGDYELLEEVARGGMGVVYKARQVSLDRIVAIKVILTGTEASADELARFRSEAQSAARLDHPYIVPVYGYGSMEGRPYLAMGLVDGPSMSAIIARHGRMDPTVAAELILKVAQAIDFAHTQQVVHRDMKPGNVLVDSSGDPRITDFGLAKRQDSDQGLTATGQVLGTPAYMAPEQAAGLDVGPSADIYSLGATLYAAITGKPPFVADSIPELLMKVAEELPAPPHDVLTSIPKSLSDICMRALAKEPADRYPTAGELAEDLSRFMAGHAIHRRSGTKQRSAMRIAAGLLVLGAIGTAAYLTLGKKENAVKENVLSNTQAATEPKASALSELEQRFLSNLSLVDESLLPPADNGGADFRFAKAADSYKLAFEEYGLDPAQPIDGERVRELNKRLPEFVESMLNALERWEYFSTVEKWDDGPSLRSLQSELETVDWRRKLRFLREDKSAEGIATLLKDLDLKQISSEQAETVAMFLLTQPPEMNEIAQREIARLHAAQPKDFWLNVIFARDKFRQGKAKPAELSTFAAEALAPLRAALVARPKQFQIHDMLAYAYSRMGNREAADREADAALTLKFPVASKPLAAMRRAIAERDFLVAIREANKLIEMEIVSPRLHAQLATLYALTGDNAKTEIEFAKLADLSGPWKDSGIIVDDAAASIVIADGAENRMKTMASYVRTNSMFWHEQITSRRLNSIEDLRVCASGICIPDLLSERIELARRMASMAPESASAQYSLGANLWQSGNYSTEALQALQKSLTLKPEAAGYLFCSAEQAAMFVPSGQALCYEQLGSSTDALRAHFLAINSVIPQDTWMRYRTIAELRDYAIRNHVMESELLEPIASDPERRGLMAMTILRATLARVNGDRPLFQSRMRDARNIAMYEPPMLCEMSRFGDGPLMLPVAIDQANASPNYPYALFSLALVAVRAGDYLLASNALDRCKPIVLAMLNEDPTVMEHHWTTAHVVIWNSLQGRLAMLQGDHLNACEYLSIAYDLDWREADYRGWSGNWDAHCADYSVALLNVGRIDDALRVANNVTTWRPYQSRGHHALGLIHLAADRLTAATTSLQRAVGLDPLDACAMIDLARAQRMSKDVVGAMTSLTKAIDLTNDGLARDFRLTALEAADLAIQIADDKSVDKPTRQAAAQDALRWMQADLDHWLQRYQTGELFNVAAVAQNLPRVLEHPVLERLNAIVKVAPLSESERQAWNDTWRQAVITRDESIRRYAEFPADRLAHFQEQDDKANTDAAQWVLAKGGHILFQELANQGRTLRASSKRELPQDKFRIVTVSLSDCDVTDEELEQLESLTNLQRLFLDGTRVTSRRLLTTLTHLPDLFELNLERTEVDDDLLPALRSIRNLYLRRTKVSAAGIATLGDRSDEYEIVHESIRPLGPLNVIDEQESETRNALSFGSGSQIVPPEIIEFGQPFTLEMVARWRPSLPNNEAIVARFVESSSSGKPGGGWPTWSLFIGQHGHLRIGAATQTVPWLDIHAGPTNPYVNHESPNHLAYQFDGTTLKGFLNGKGFKGIEIPLAGKGNLMTCNFGGVPGHDDWVYDGLIDEVRISSIARYDDDFTPVRRFESDEQTLALYHLDEGHGDIAHDASGNGRDVKIVLPSWVPESEVYR